MFYYEITDGGRNIHIVDSRKVSKRDFHARLKEIWVHYSDCEVFNRSFASMEREWCVHNFLYAIGIARSRTKDTDLNYQQAWYIKCAYSVLGVLCWVFVK